MRPFLYERVDSPQAALAAFATAPADADRQYLAGGTTLVDLMKLDVMRPQAVIDINALDRTAAGRIEVGPRGLRLGALTRMGDAAEHPAVVRDYPVIAQTLKLAASAQLRNMASLGGNVLQRTRCPYFRDVSYASCNKRNPGSGCTALESIHRDHAVLGVSDACIALYPGDFAQALIALEAVVELAGPTGERRISFAELHRMPGDTPQLETTLQPGELITAFLVPAAPWTRRSLYLKVRQRESYEFALASAAVALDLTDDRLVSGARVAVGGVATIPWRAQDAEAVLLGKILDEQAASAAADAAFANARPRTDNAYKVALGKRTLVRALLQAATMET
jgi:xanthine dehydrogenase YagS FAD-binding subunit